MCVLVALYVGCLKKLIYIKYLDDKIMTVYFEYLNKE
jgi:hypothetical protein